MDSPIQEKIVCWALRSLGGVGKVGEILREILGASPGAAPNPSIDLESLQRVLARGNGRLWTRILPGTYQLTDDGVESISGLTGGNGAN